MFSLIFLNEEGDSPVTCRKERVRAEPLEKPERMATSLIERL